MSKPIIQVQNLSKFYQIRHQVDSDYATLTETIASFFRKKQTDASGKELVRNEQFKALDDVSFDVHPGDRIGIIGRNGAGKSTLLKLLTRITEPSAGRFVMRGRVASLLEVGTGFHPELNGRENIYLNGAILGLKRAEIKRKFDEIVDFSGIEKFLDTPVKRYSSGMYVRLAFAVAAHLESEILLVDEVLAVGDMEFQKKCLGKMNDISTSEGRTILFISHDLSALRRLCNRGLLLDFGKLVCDKPLTETIEAFYEKLQVKESLRMNIEHRTDRLGNGLVHIKNIIFRHDDAAASTVGFQTMDEVFVEVLLESRTAMNKHVNIEVSFTSLSGERLTRISTEEIDPDFAIVHGEQKIVFRIPRLPLCPKRFLINTCVYLNGICADLVNSIGMINVVSGAHGGFAIPSSNIEQMVTECQLVSSKEKDTASPAMENEKNMSAISCKNRKTC